MRVRIALGTQQISTPWRVRTHCDGGINGGAEDPARYPCRAAHNDTVYGPVQFGGSASDDCRTSPGPSAQAGLHWYYRTDRMNKRHCWYLLASAVSRPTPRPKTVAEQAQETQSKNDTVQTVPQTPINTSD